MNVTAASLGCNSWIDVVTRRAAETPDREAFTFLLDGESQQIRWDYRKLDTRARAIAAQLREHCQPGDRAMLLYQPGAEFIAAFIGCLYAGVIAVPGYPPRSADHERALPRLAKILNDAQPTTILTAGAKTLNIIQESVVAAGGNPRKCVDTETVPDSLAATWTRPGSINAQTIAFLQYTSGSTSAPKGVVLTHENLLNNSAAIRDRFRHDENSRGLIWLPPYHDMGLIGGILQPIFAGFPVTLMPPATFLQRPLRWLKNISDWRATTSGGPDFAFDLAVRSIKLEDRATLDLSSWKIAYSGAEPVRKATLDRFADAFEPYGLRREIFYPCYGLAEATLFVSGPAKEYGAKSVHYDANALSENRAVPAEPSPNGVRTTELVGCGGPVPNTEYKIVSPTTFTPCESDNIGEIWVHGPGIAQGYWNLPAESRETFSASIAGQPGKTWLRTGDLGLISEAGDLFVTGRLNDLIIIRGQNHYPQDIEQSAGTAHPALRPGGGAAFSIDHDGEERLVLVHEIERTQRDADPEEIFSAIRESISLNHELQTHAIVLLKPARLPRTSSGKVRRSACRDAFNSGEDLGEFARSVAASNKASGSIGAVELSAPGPRDATSLEVWLTAKLAAALGVSSNEIEPAEPFARYGLDSAKAVALSSQFATELNLSLEPTLFWDYPTIRALAEYLASGEEDQPAANLAKVA